MTTWEEFLNDAAYDDYLEKRHLEEIAEEGVDAFSRERLQAYYRQHPTVAQAALSALHTAEVLVDLSASASLVFAAVSLELTIKDAILHPLVYGLVNNEAVAGFVAQYAVGRGGAGRFDRLLLQLLNELADVDLSTYRRDGQTLNLWEEVLRVTRLRNQILHSGQDATRDEAMTALAVSRTLLLGVFPAVIQALDMTTNGDLEVL